MGEKQSKLREYGCISSKCLMLDTCSVMRHQSLKYVDFGSPAHVMIGKQSRPLLASLDDSVMQGVYPLEATLA